MATEPKTIVSIIDETLGLGNDPVDTNLNILCPIISPTGPTKLTRVTGPSMLRRYFNGGSAITPDSSQTLQYARAVTAQAPIYVKRASRSEIKGGKTATSYGTPFYVDELNNPLSGAIIELTNDIPSAANYDTLLGQLKSYVGGVTKSSELTYISTSAIENSQVGQPGPKDIIKSTATGFVPKDGNYIQFVTGEQITSVSKDVTVEVANNKFTIAEDSTDLLVLFKSIIQKGIKAIAISSSNSIFYDSIENTITPNTGTTINFIAFDSPVKLTYEAEEDKDIIINSASSSLPTFYINTIYTKSEYNGELDCTPFSILATIDSKTYHIHTSDVDFITTYDYNIEVDIPASGLTFPDACKSIYDQLEYYATIGADSESRFVISGLTAVEDLSIDGKTARVTGTKVGDFNSPVSDIFGVVAKFPNETDSITVNCVDNNDSTYTLTINAFGNEEMFTISFIPGAVDGYGNDIYYTNVEAQSEYVSVIYLGGTLFNDCTLNIGAEVKSEFVGIKELSATLEDMMETEESPVLFDYILDGGIVDKSYSAMILQACEYYKSFYPASCQTDNMSVSNMKSNRNNLGNGQQSMRCNFIAAAQRDSVLDSGLITMPASYYYLTYRIGLAKSVMEFSAVFGKNNGNIGIINPIKDYKKSDRESMLDSQIITLKRSMADGSWYLNLNMTCYGKDSYLQEDGIVLMNNKISQIAMAYAETLKGEYNTPELRSQVTGTLTGYLNTRLRVGTAYGPGSIRVVCDNTNNPQNLINQRKLAIDIYGRFANSIKDVLIYQHVQPLEG